MYYISKNNLNILSQHYIRHMPAVNGQYESQEEMLAARKYNNNKRHKITYWRKKYKVNVTSEQYETFSKHVTIIKKALPIIEFIKQLEMIETEEERTTTLQEIVESCP